MGACERAGQGSIQIGSDGLAVANCDEVDVFAQPPVRQVGAGQRCAADEVDSVAEVPGQERQEVRDEVITFDLFSGDAELFCYGGLFVAVH